MSGGTNFVDVAAAIAEYTADDISTLNGYVTFEGWSGPNLAGAPLIDASLVGGTNPLTDSVENVFWTPLTAYSNAGDGQVKAHSVDLQSVLNPGTSGATEPTWTGGLTNDGSMKWQDTGTFATDGLMNMLSICVSDGFVEFPVLSGSGGYTLRESKNDANIGIRLYEKNTTWIDSETVTFTKSVNTYSVAFSLVPMGASAPTGTSVTVSLTGLSTTSGVDSLGFSSGSTVIGLLGIGPPTLSEGFVQTQAFYAPVPPLDPLSLTFRPVRSRLSSRYSGAYIAEIQTPSVTEDIPILPGTSNPFVAPPQSNPDIQPFVAAWNPIRMSPDPTDRWISVPRGLEARLDIISQKVYNRPDLWWVLAYSNDIINPFERPMAGDKLRIPNLSRILRTFGQIGNPSQIALVEIPNGIPGTGTPVSSTFLNA